MLQRVCLILTSDADARLGLLHARGVHVKPAVVAALMNGPHPLDGDDGDAVVGGGDQHVRILDTNTQRHTLLVRQYDFVVLVVPSNLPH